MQLASSFLVSWIYRHRCIRKPAKKYKRTIPVVERRANPLVYLCLALSNVDTLMSNRLALKDVQVCHFSLLYSLEIWHVGMFHSIEYFVNLLKSHSARLHPHKDY